MNDWFCKIVSRRVRDKNLICLTIANGSNIRRPITEAFFHAHFILKMAIKYVSRELQTTPAALPSGWAAVLYLYNLR